MGNCFDGLSANAPAGKPVLYYFPFAGRGEVARLCAAAGGLTLEEKVLDPKGDRAELCKECGAVGTGVPVLKHGTLKMCQSAAIQNYICLISPKFKKLPLQARAVDAMWFAHVEDIVGDVAKAGLFGELFGGPKCDSAALATSVHKWFSHFESMVPDTGFINNTPFPTGADCVVLTFFRAAAPHAYMFKFSGVDPSKFPKLKKLADRTAAAPGIKEYLAKSTSFGLDPFKK